jgi:hypothetical protein
MNRTIMAMAGLNLALVGYLMYAAASGSARKSSEPTVSESATDTKPAPRSQAAPAAGSPKRRFREAFHWQSLSSPDLKRYAANLRAVQCPEETVRDIILAEMGRQYASREQALKARPQDVLPWEAVTSYERKNNETKLRQLLAEKRDAIKDALGVDTPVEAPPKLAGRNLERFETAFNDLPENKREQVRTIQERYWSQSDDIKSRTLGFLEPEDRDEFKRIKTERRDEMAKILTSQELEDYEMKTSPTGNALRSRTADFKPTDEEFRNMFRITQPLDEENSLISGTYDKEDKALVTRRTEAERQWQEQLRGVLGDERYTEMERSRDPAYRNVNQAGQEAGLAKEAIVQIYESQRSMQTEVKRMFQDPNLTPEQRAQTIAAMQGQAETALRTLAGEKAAEILQKISQPQPTDPALMKRYGLAPVGPVEPGQPTLPTLPIIPSKP